MTARKRMKAIKFTIEGRRYEAVDFFLTESEIEVTGETMFTRTAGKNGGAIGEEDEAFLSERRDKFPAKLEKHYLVTNRRNPSNPLRVSCFYWDRCSYRWYQDWGELDYPWYNDTLVLRRLP